MFFKKTKTQVLEKADEVRTSIDAAVVEANVAKQQLLQDLKKINTYFGILLGLIVINLILVTVAIFLLI